MVVSRHEFLAALHQALKPKVYLEIGVQTGASLVLAERAEMAVGVDPEPLISMSRNQLPNQQIFTMTSDNFFEQRAFVLPPVDLAFIDGSHLFEDAMCDYVNVQKRMNPGGIIVFDDVLPYNEAIASRVQPPGDWTGDVWKCYFLLDEMYRSGLIGTEPLLVDTWPTGTMVLLNVEPVLTLPSRFLSKEDLRQWFATDHPVPTSILSRTDALPPHEILERLQ